MAEVQSCRYAPCLQYPKSWLCQIDLEVFFFQLVFNGMLMLCLYPVIYQQTLCKIHWGNTWQHSLGKNVRCKFQQSQGSGIARGKKLLCLDLEYDSSRCVTYFNVSNNHTVSMSVQEIFPFGISTQNQWLPPLCPGQGSKQSLCGEKERRLFNQTEWLTCDKRES
jgi:hypothetical protein